MDINALKTIAEWSYNVTPMDKGYTDKTLYVNVSNGEIKEKSVPALMKEKFIGGKGYGLKLLWDATKADTKWNDPENEQKKKATKTQFSLTKMLQIMIIILH